jgi:hypothetical protein
MDFKDFDEMIDAVEIDPRARMKLGARRVIDRELADVPEDVVALILPSRLSRLARRAREIEREHLAQIDALLNAFVSELTNAALWEKKKCELIAVARRIAERELADVPDDLATQILPSRLDRLTQRAQEAFERGHPEQIDKLLNEYAADLRGAVLRERQSGALQPISPDSEIKRCRGQLSDRVYGAYEVGALRHTLRAGERILSVDFQVIETSMRTITRKDLFDAYPWDRVMSQELRERMFVSERAIEEAEQRARQQFEADTRAPGARNFVQ